MIFLKNFYHGFHVLYQSWQTVKIFDPSEDKFYCNYGYYITSDVGDFYPKKEMADQAREFVICLPHTIIIPFCFSRIFNPILGKMKACATKVKNLELTETDIALIAGTLFCETGKPLQSDYIYSLRYSRNYKNSASYI